MSAHTISNIFAPPTTFLQDTKLNHDENFTHGKWYISVHGEW